MSDPVPSTFIFGQDTGIESPVGELSIRFYPVSVAMLLRLKGWIGPIAKAIVTLTASNPNDVGTVTKEDGAPYVNENEEPITIAVGGVEQMVRDVETEVKAIDPQIARFRSEERSAAITELMMAFGDEKNIQTLGDICQDSMRVPEQTKVPGAQFMEKIEAPAFYQILAGVAKANKDVFGPLAELTEPGFNRLRDFVGLDPEKEPNTTTAQDSPAEPEEPAAQVNPAREEETEVATAS